MSKSEYRAKQGDHDEAQEITAFWKYIFNSYCPGIFTWAAGIIFQAGRVDSSAYRKKII